MVYNGIVRCVRICVCLVILEIYTVAALYKEAVCGWDCVCQCPIMALSGGGHGNGR